MKNFVVIFLILAVQFVSAQFSLGVSVGNSNFRRIVPYYGSTHNLPVMVFAEGNVNYQFKKKPIIVGLNGSFFVEQRIEETFKLPNSPYWSRTFNSYFRQHFYMITVNYSWLNKNKVLLYSGINLGAYSMVANFSADLFSNGPTIQYVDWDKNRTRIFRGTFGLQSGLIIGEKKFRTKIEVRHVFFGQYEFADFGREMNTSLSVGVLYTFR
jgi:hypothetical protein